MRLTRRCGRRSPFSGCQSLLAPVRHIQRRADTSVRAMVAQWPDPGFVAEVTEEFPEKGVATVEEARVGALITLRLSIM